jgi:hypothetical protein
VAVNKIYRAGKDISRTKAGNVISRTNAGNVIPRTKTGIFFAHKKSAAPAPDHKVSGAGLTCNLQYSV